MDPEPSVTANTPYGMLRGIRRGATQVFKGIPYARAGRFERPVPVTGWAGELDATSYRAQCPQLIGMVEQALGASSVPMDEDCLHLNVFTPACDDGRRPVLVWLHGGAFTSGSGSMPWYDGSSLCRRGDVVVVTLNYRLGALGFAGPDNLGTRDQIAALQWVSEQIGSFGGDPANVTIFGESAGGSAVVSLMAVPSAAGLFARGIALSPSITQLRSRARADEALAELCGAADVATAQELRVLPLAALLDAQAVLLRDVGAGFTGFSPCADGELIPDTIVDAAAANAIPLLIGTTRDEMSLFSAFNPALSELDDDSTRALFARRFGEGAGTALAAYREARPGAAARQLVAAMQTDETFRVPARRLAEQRVASGNVTWMYWFTWPTPAFGGVLGSCHAVDIPFAFDNLDRPGVAEFTGTDDTRQAVADAYSNAVLAFARRADPGWAAYDIHRRATWRVDVTPAVLDDPEPSLRTLWERV